MLTWVCIYLFNGNSTNSILVFPPQIFVGCLRTNLSTILSLSLGCEMMGRERHLLRTFSPT